MQQDNNSYLFESIQPMVVKDRFGTQHTFLGLNKLEYTAATIAGPMLMAEINNHGFENLKSFEQYECLAKMATDFAKAILQRCNDEKIIYSKEQAEKTAPGIVKSL